VKRIPQRDLKKIAAVTPKTVQYEWERGSTGV